MIESKTTKQNQMEKTPQKTWRKEQKVFTKFFRTPELQTIIKKPDNSHIGTDFVVWKCYILGKAAYLGEGCICNEANTRLPV